MENDPLYMYAEGNRESSSNWRPSNNVVRNSFSLQHERNEALHGMGGLKGQ